MPSAPSPVQQLVLVGAGGHGLVVAEAAIAAGLVLAGAFDDDAMAVTIRRLALPHLGKLAEAPGAIAPGRGVILALGDLAHRRRVLEKLGNAFTRASGRVVHPAAILQASARVEPGTYVGPRAVLHSFAAAGPHAIINSGAIVEHECVLGSNVHIAPGAVLGGRVRVGDDTLIGLGARVLPNLTIGRGCVVGAGAVVIRDVPDGAKVVGVPAKAINPANSARPG